MTNRYVVDTTSLISYFKDIFKVESKISVDSVKIIHSGFMEENIILIIPNIVFVEIFKKWYKNTELAEKIRYEVYQKVISRPNIQIRPLDFEVLENFIKIVDIESDQNFDNHDKQILACAMMLDCNLITSDRRLIRYNNRKKVIPAIFS